MDEDAASDDDEDAADATADDEVEDVNNTHVVVHQNASMMAMNVNFSGSSSHLALNYRLPLGPFREYLCELFSSKLYYMNLN